MRFRDIVCYGMFSLLVGLSGCNGAHEEAGTDSRLMRFEVMHPARSKVTADAFEKGDRVGVFVTRGGAPLELSGNVVNNALLTYDGARWNLAKTAYWDAGQHDVFAYYPHVERPTAVDDLPFSVATDQTTPRTGTTLGGYEASDFLWGSVKGVTASGNAVAVPFKHRMSRLVVRLVKGEDYDGDLPREVEVYVHGTVTSATIDLAAGIVTKDPHGTEQTIRAMQTGEHAYSAILVPQRLMNARPLVEVVMKGVSYLVEKAFIFKMGVQHTITLVIAKNPEQVKIEIGGEIENWE